ncbi:MULTISPECIES: hypothetical protein [Mycobacteroides]|uniref:Uncharacterized protein n=1 Tax=Mycobacteroides chelonae TaxID=1774 RepID=A0AB73MWC1_MYCCH|nr:MULTISPECIES: hypothetical protein [Mycobacteroides]KRQ31290.1 hypothetical protein AOT86_01355 [Mycobacteroides sp. H072]KRQ35953.1 hypothetical protein AOT84_15755 [Mycobacteroides sp. H002]KRQ50509.1 hypothetical protein AOT85_13475 [Mycobacteroides sp. H054]KRQ72729.1 hypothetical protein AOT83_05050 [Mycobacteroides sp. H001]MBN7369288.1 hypothetical protein [Mycobacteroides abscessus subsp. abscessus]
MTIEHDDYPELPPLPVPVQLACQSIEPEHLLLPREDMQVLADVGHAIHAFVSRCIPHLDTETVEMTTYRALLAVQGVVQDAWMAGGDVTSRE